MKQETFSKWILVWLMLAIESFVLAGCGGSDNNRPDAGTIDAAVDDAGNLLVDAAPMPPGGFVNVPLNCQPYTRSVRHAATDGSKDVTINSYAITDLVPGDAFIVTTCNATIVPTCSGGDVCMGDQAPSSIQTCFVTHDADFLDGKLVLLCGVRTEHYTSAGMLTSFTQSSFTIKLERPL